MWSKWLQAQIGILILATSIIQLANGFFGTFISLRVAIEGFEPTVSGLILSSYFAGFTWGALRCDRLARGQWHFQHCARLADSLGAHFGWKLEIARGAGHVSQQIYDDGADTLKRQS